MPQKNGRKVYRERCKGERDRRIYIERVVKKKSAAEVGKMFGLSGSAVYQIIKEQEKKFIARHDFTVENIKQNHSERLEKLISESLEQWERSKLDSVVVQETVNSALSKIDIGEDGDGEPPQDKTVTTTKGQCGDVSYLLAVAKFLADIRKIWGADEPKKVEISGNIELQGSATPVPTPEELQRRIDERLKVLYGPPKKTIVVDAQRRTLPAVNPKQVPTPKIPPKQ